MADKDLKGKNKVGKVFLTNAQQRKTLSAARSLGKKGIAVAACETTGLNPTRFSRYCGDFYKCPDPALLPDEYVTFLIDKIASGSYETIFPMDDDSMELVIDNQGKFDGICRLALPSKESFRFALDKGKTIAIAKKAGAVCPETISIDDLDSLPSKIAHMKFPLVIKPVNSSGSRGIRIVRDEKSFYDTYAEIHNAYPFPLVQEYIGGNEKVDVCLIYNKKSELRACFIQKELRHFPAGIGPSTVQESIYHTEAKEIALRIMDELPWVGVVELEFMIDRENDRIVFMEINPRFWASLEMAVLAGVDFPDLYHKIAMTGDCEEVFAYREGVRARWLYPGDILYFLTSKDRFRMNPPFLNGKRQRLIDDTFSWTDPLPLLGVLMAAFYYLINKKRRDFILNR
ncbi:MAG: carboxylate--amine ligase [Saccharofermentanales bacterium]